MDNTKTQSFVLVFVPFVPFVSSCCPLIEKAQGTQFQAREAQVPTPHKL